MPIFHKQQTGCTEIVTERLGPYPDTLAVAEALNPNKPNQTNPDSHINYGNHTCSEVTPSTIPMRYVVCGLNSELKNEYLMHTRWRPTAVFMASQRPRTITGQSPRKVLWGTKCYLPYSSLGIKLNFVLGLRSIAKLNILEDKENSKRNTSELGL